MPEYLSPGVYMEEVDTGSKPIEAVGTAMPAFVGYAPAGPFNAPELITNWTQFCERFGDASGSPYLPKTYLAHALYGYFNNGGQRCYVVRVPRGEDIVSNGHSAQPAQAAMAKLGALQIRALQPGSEGNDIKVEVKKETEEGGPERYKLIVTRGEETETIDGVGTGTKRQPLSRENVATAVKEKSRLIQVEVLSGALEDGSIQLVGGAAPIAPADAASTALVPNDFVGDDAARTGMGGFSAVEGVTMLCVPDLMAGLYNRQLLHPKMRRMNGKEIATCPRCKMPFKDPATGKPRETPNPVPECPTCHAVGEEVVDTEAVEARKTQIIGWQTAMLNHCENMHDRVAILDAPPGLKPTQVYNYRMKEGNFDSKYGTLYYPWIQVMDPIAKAPVYVPPCGHMAGIWARNDQERGVHKAPANEVVRGAIGLEYSLSKGEQDTLNPEGVNCIREFPGRGRRVWGARTLSSDPSWRYLNIRRLFNMLEKSIERDTQWVVFEPNDYDLWQRVRRNISAFLRVQHMEGKLFGATPDEAFYVKCDAETNPPESIELGRLICEIGVRPVYPAEFVIFRIGQWAMGSSVNE